MENTDTANSNTAGASLPPDFDNCPVRSNKSQKSSSSSSSSSSTVKIDNATTQKYPTEQLQDNANGEVDHHSSAAVKNSNNEESCPPIYGLSSDLLGLCFSMVGNETFRFVAGTSKRFCNEYLDTFRGEKTTSLSSTAESESRVKLYLAEVDNPESRYYEVFRKAAIDGRLNVLQSAQGSGYDLKTILDERVIADAAGKGRLDVIKYLRNLAISWDADTCNLAASNGHLDVLKWARTNGCPWNEDTCCYAAQNGHLEVLKWARANGCPWDFRTCSYAARGGHLEVLKWARTNGCPWNQDTCWFAAQGGHLEVLKWARANGCPWDFRTCSYAARGGHLEVLKWARTNGCPGTT